MANIHTGTTSVRHREHDRYAACFGAALTDLEGRETPIAAFIANLSERGVRVMTPIAIHPGQIVKVQIADARLVGEVTYSKPDGNYFCTGLKLHLPESGEGISKLRHRLSLAPTEGKQAPRYLRRTVSRKHLRHPVSAAVRVLWRDGDGGEVILGGKVENISETGARLRLDRMLPVRSYVSCNDELLALSGTASVRYCRFFKGKYDIGLEFSGGTGWRKPKAGLTRSS